jgi:hypothetical protein
MKAGEGIVMVQAVSPSTSVANLVAVRSAQADAPGVIMPVRPAQAIYASFRHIDVLPDSRLADGVPLYKLRILDSLIDRLSQVQGNGSGGAAAISAAARRDPASVDRWIADLAGGLRAAGGSSARGGVSASYRAGFFPLPGAFVDLVA